MCFSYARCTWCLATFLLKLLWYGQNCQNWIPNCSQKGKKPENTTLWVNSRNTPLIWVKHLDINKITDKKTKWYIPLTIERSTKYQIKTTYSIEELYTNLPVIMDIICERWVEFSDHSWKSLYYGNQIMRKEEDKDKTFIDQLRDGTFSVNSKNSMDEAVVH